MKFEFIEDLDGYFCEKYANYDKICILPGYRMPKMQETTVDAFGRKYSYTLPAETMRLAKQEKCSSLLVELKSRMTDKNFSFSFRPLGFFQRISDVFSKDSFQKTLKAVCGHHNADPISVVDGLEINPAVWKRILSGEFYPSKPLVLALGLSAHFTYQETKALLRSCGYDFQFEDVSDTVISYLLLKEIYNKEMVQAAFAEYKLLPLPIKN
ncbi:MAG: hypothetical protein IJF39_01235 [Clostridia bacterium]|nr:hypothetical protein [Clostridia bacterium]